ncbi:MAG: biotin/lipoyl-binding protein, partial [Anaerolineales bacterium]
MNHNRPPLPVVIVLLVATLGIIAYFLYQQSLAPQNGALTASGTVEAVQIKVAAEIGGKVTEVNAAEGDSVKAGDVLFRLDPAILTAQRNAAAAALNTAKAAAATAQSAITSAQTQYDLALLAAQAEEQPLRANQWRLPTPADFDQPLWYFTREEQLAAVQAELDAAQSALQAAQARLIQMRQKDFALQTEYDKFVAAENQLAAARAAYQNAKDLLDRTVTASRELRDAAQTAFDDAKANLQDAQKAYDDLLKTDTAQDILDARADLALAQERYYTARDRLRALQTGDFSPKLAAAQAALEQAHRVYEQAQAAVAQ